jgi:hypothetical protein
MTLACTGAPPAADRQFVTSEKHNKLAAIAQLRRHQNKLRANAII